MIRRPASTRSSATLSAAAAGTASDAGNDVLVAGDFLPESSGALRGLTKTSTTKTTNCISDKIGQSNCVIFARFVQTGRFAFPRLTRSLAHVCDGIAQSREKFKVGSNPVRVVMSFH